MAEVQETPETQETCSKDYNKACSELKKFDTHSILSQEEINMLLDVIDEDKDEVEPISDKNLYDFRRPNIIAKEDLRILRDFFREMEEEIKDWVGHDLRYASLHSIDQVKYSEFLLSISDLAEHYINIQRNEINTNIVLGIDDSLLIGLNGDPSINRKTNRSEFNELKIAEGIASFLKKNNVITNAVVIKEDKDTEMKQFPEYYPGMYLLYELYTKGISTGCVHIFIPFEIIKFKIKEIEERLKEIKNSNNSNNSNKEIKINLTAKLGETEIDLNTLKNLTEFDTFFLNRKTNDPIEIYSGNKKFFEGEVIVNENDDLGIVITKNFLKEEEINELRV